MGYFLVIFTDGNQATSQAGPCWEEWDQEISNSLVAGGNADCGLVVTQDEKLKSKTDNVKGYRLIKASDFAEAVEISKGAPPLYHGGHAEVYPV